MSRMKILTKLDGILFQLMRRIFKLGELVKMSSPTLNPTPIYPQQNYIEQQYGLFTFLYFHNSLVINSNVF